MPTHKGVKIPPRPVRNRGEGKFEEQFLGEQKEKLWGNFAFEFKFPVFQMTIFMKANCFLALKFWLRPGLLI